MITDHPQYLAIGHITVDVIPEGLAAGGTVAYASRAVSRLGLSCGIVTASGDELDWTAELPSIDVVRHSTPRTTTFQNLYENGIRTQWLLAEADPIPPKAVPIPWRGCPIVHLAPVVHEIDGGFADLFSGSLLAMTPQGLLRQWNGNGLVTPGKWVGDRDLLSACQVVILSEDDVAGDPEFVAMARESVDIVVVTRGASGAELHLRRRQSFHFPAFPAKEVDPTGAGDVFTAAFLVEYHRTGDPRGSAAFATCAASFAVEQRGIEGVQGRGAVEERLALYKQYSEAWGLLL